MAAQKTAEPSETMPELVHASEVVAKPRKDAATRRQEQMENLGGIKNRLYSDSAKVVSNFLRAGDIDPEVDADRDPAYWNMMTEMGDEEEVKKAYRVARTGWLPGNETPGFVKMAGQVLIGIMKANAAEKGGTKVLNVGKILVSADSIPQFEEREVE